MLVLSRWAGRQPLPSGPFGAPVILQRYTDFRARGSEEPREYMGATSCCKYLQGTQVCFSSIIDSLHRDTSEIVLSQPYQIVGQDVSSAVHYAEASLTGVNPSFSIYCTSSGEGVGIAHARRDFGLELPTKAKRECSPLSRLVSRHSCQ